MSTKTPTDHLKIALVILRRARKAGNVGEVAGAESRIGIAIAELDAARASSAMPNAWLVVHAPDSVIKHVADIVKERDELRARPPARAMPRPRFTQTHTHAYLDVDRATFVDVRARLAAVDYGHTFGDDDGRRTIDMHGIALREPDPKLHLCIHVGDQEGEDECDDDLPCFSRAARKIREGDTLGHVEAAAAHVAPNLVVSMPPGHGMSDSPEARAAIAKAFDQADTPEGLELAAKALKHIPNEDLRDPEVRARRERSWDGSDRCPTGEHKPGECPGDHGK